MSAVSLAESEVSNLASSELVALSQRGSLNGNPTHRKSCGRTGQARQSTEILQPSTGQQSLLLTFLQEDSPVKTQVSPILKEKESKDRGQVFGNIILKQLGCFDQSSSSLRTSQISLTEDSRKSLKTLPRSGMTRNGTLYATSSWSKAKESGSSWKEKGWSRLPTPIAQAGKGYCHNRPISRTMSILRWPKSCWREGNCNYPNPHYLEWIQDFPKDWTALDASAMQSVQECRKRLRMQSKGA